jgi:hypothetical protein
MLQNGNKLVGVEKEKEVAAQAADSQSATK